LHDPAPRPRRRALPSLLRKFIVTLPWTRLVTGQSLTWPPARTTACSCCRRGVEVQTGVVGRILGPAAERHRRAAPVTIVEARDEVLWSEGINVGDEIIAEPPRELSPGALVDPVR